MDLNLSGIWSGKMIDAEGFNALAQLEIKTSRGKVSGTVSYTLIDDHEELQEFKGELEGQLDDEGRIYFEYTLADQGTVRFTGQSFEVRHHAKAAFGGTYRITRDENKEIAGGVGMFWMYERKIEG